MKEKEKKFLNTSVPVEMYNKLIAYANQYTQGNVSYAIRLAIDLLLAESARINTKSN